MTTQRIRNIGNYRVIKLGKRYEDGEFHTINLQRRKFGFDIFRTGMYARDGQEYLGHNDFAETFRYLQMSYDVGYKTIERQRL